MKQYRRRRRFKRKPIALQPHSFCERVEETIALNNANIDNNGNLNTTHVRTFKMNDMTQYTYYKAIFEEYQLNKIVVTFNYSPSLSFITDAGALRPINACLPLLYFKVDHNDDTPNTITEMKQSMKTRTKKLKDNETFSIQLKPAYFDKIEENDLTGVTKPEWGKWINADFGSIEHYGLKLQVLTAGIGNDTMNLGSIHIEYKYYFRMKCNE
jgi:hypothetical protein